MNLLDSRCGRGFRAAELDSDAVFPENSELQTVQVNKNIDIEISDDFWEIDGNLSQNGNR